MAVISAHLGDIERSTPLSRFVISKLVLLNKMIRDYLIAKQLSDCLLDTSFRLRESVAFVQKTCSLPEVVGYRLCIDTVLAQVKSVLDAIYSIHPSLVLSVSRDTDRRESDSENASGTLESIRSLGEVKPEPIANMQAASQLNVAVLDVWRRLYQSSSLVKQNVSADEENRYRKAVGTMLADLMLYLDALYVRHPSLRPTDW